MPKKMGVNTRSEEARNRKASAEAEKKEKDARDKEERFWRDELESQKSKAAKKKEEEAERRAEAAAKKAEAKKLAQQEEAQLESVGKRVDKKAIRVSAPVPKVTAVEISKHKEAEKERMQLQSEEAKKRQARTVDVEEYERAIDVENVNRDDTILEARSIEDALAKMATPSELPADRHPEKRLKASYKAFEAAELPKLKAEKPGLTLTQYKDMLWKLWKKSPDNPINQAN